MEQESTSYECPECHLSYKEKEWMNKCEVWCKEYHSCNLEIIAHAIENEKKKDDTKFYNNI